MSTPENAAPASFERYVALGDSTTEGLMDFYPDGERLRGWADRLAEKLAAINPGLRYANLAVRGRKLPQIRADQLEPGLALEPDLVSILGGVNDVLRRHVDLEAIARDLEDMVAAFARTGATVLMVTSPDLTTSIKVATRRFGPRVSRFNQTIREIAARRGALVVDLEKDDLHHPSLWAPDRLHASPLGHERIADVAAATLGIAELDPEWPSRLPERPGRTQAVELAHDTVWVVRHAVPWVIRRLRGVSSGDGISAKRPELAPVGPPPRGV